jgi:hypothetical protein
LNYEARLVWLPCHRWLPPALRKFGEGLGTLKTFDLGGISRGGKAGV